MNMRQWAYAMLCLLWVFGVPLAAAGPAPIPSIELQIGRHAIRAEVASTQAEREHGLMGRTRLTQNAGMLFVFPETDFYAMWMKNTPLPLSVAFIDEQGAIINIAEMVPHSEKLHSAKRPAKFALEMPAGWFDRRAIGPGAKVRGLGKAPAAH